MRRNHQIKPRTRQAQSQPVTTKPPCRCRTLVPIRPPEPQFLASFLATCRPLAGRDGPRGPRVSQPPRTNRTRCLRARHEKPPRWVEGKQITNTGTIRPCDSPFGEQVRLSGADRLRSESGSGHHRGAHRILLCSDRAPLPMHSDPGTVKRSARVPIEYGLPPIPRPDVSWPPASCASPNAVAIARLWRASRRARLHSLRAMSG